MDQQPFGWLDAADTDGIRGWAFDPDEPGRALEVHVYIGGPAGDPAAVGYSTVAGNERADLCGAIGSCNHGFHLDTPRGFLDGVARPVFVYAISGVNPQLSGVPGTLLSGAPTLPLEPAAGVLRHVPNPEAMGSWRFDWNDILVLPQEVVDQYPRGVPWVQNPALLRGDGQFAVYVREHNIRRHVPSPAAIASWRFDWNAIAVVPPVDVDALIDGAPLMPRPFLLRGTTGPEVWVLDAPPPLRATLVSQDLPSQSPPGGAATVTVRLANRGSATWDVGSAFLVPANGGTSDGMCAPSWNGCTRAGGVQSNVAPGGEGAFTVDVVVPATPGAVTQCFALEVAGHRSSDPGQGGPVDGALCLTTTVTETASTTTPGSPGGPSTPEPPDTPAGPETPSTTPGDNASGNAPPAGAPSAPPGDRAPGDGPVDTGNEGITGSCSHVRVAGSQGAGGFGMLLLAATMSRAVRGRARRSRVE